MPGPRDRRGKNAARPSTIQGCAPPGSHPERAAGVRRHRAHRRRARPAAQRSAGDRDQGVAGQDMKFFLTTAIDYVNSKPHLGTAYEKITADVIARYKRLAGFDTRFLMGNDEHSQNVFKKAAEE